MSENARLTVGILTLGCRVNQYESESIAEALEKNGFRIRPFEEKNDVYIINTCSVTAESDRKSRQMIRRACQRKKEDPSVIVCAVGCFTQGASDKSDVFEGVDYICGNVGKSDLPEKIVSLVLTRETVPHIEVRGFAGAVYEPYEISRSHIVRAFVKIEDGCNSFCSYCFVPYVRGRVRSRSADEIVEEVKRLNSNGYSEIVLTGIETSSYGEDLSEDTDLIRLVERIESETETHRIRFGSLKPSLFTEDFAREISSFEKTERHFHLSIQSGSSKVLSAMRRDYGKDDMLRVFDRIYRYIPEAGLSADFICGFPGETENDFLDTVEIVEKGRLLHSHIFPYSKRAKTAAAVFPDQITDEVKKDRVARLISLSENVSEMRRADFCGKELEILIEKIEDGRAYGYTENLIYTSVPLEKGDKIGDFRKIIYN